MLASKRCYLQPNSEFLSFYSCKHDQSCRFADQNHIFQFFTHHQPFKKCWLFGVQQVCLSTCDTRSVTNRTLLSVMIPGNNFMDFLNSTHCFVSIWSLKLWKACLFTGAPLPKEDRSAPLISSSPVKEARGGGMNTPQVKKEIKSKLNHLWTSIQPKCQLAPHSRWWWWNWYAIWLFI